MSPPTGRLPDAPSTAGLVMIGNEILSGKVEDCNAPYLCKELRFLGVDVQRILTIPDDFEQIASSVREFSQAYSWVFTSGGIGPTHDDITVPAIASGFGVDTITDPNLAELLRVHYQERLTDAHMRMAMVPEGAELIDIKGLSYPQIQFNNIFILPGVPELFRYKFNAIKERFADTPIILHEIFLKADEGDIAEVLSKTDAAHPEILIGSYPSFFRDEYSVKVTLEGRDEADVESALAEVQAYLQETRAKVAKVT